MQQRLMRQGFGVDSSYLWILLGAFCISGLTHLGVARLPLPGMPPASDQRQEEGLEVEWVMDTLDRPREVPPEPKDPKYVETNPNVPENEPDKTSNESNRNQQSAQENPSPESRLDVPKVDGETEESQKIIEGRVAENAPAPEPGVYSLDPLPAPNVEESPREKSGQDKKHAKAPLPPPAAKLEILPSTGEGVTAVIQENFETKNPSQSRTIPLEIPLNPDPKSQEVKELNPSLAKPRPRPRLPASVTPGPVRVTNTSSTRTGTLAIDAKWSKFGEYSQRMIAAISLQWHKLVFNAGLDSQLRSTVHVRFILNNRGLIESIQVVETSAGQLSTLLCKDAVESRAPFGQWTVDMVQVFGEQTDVNIRFLCPCHS